MLKHTLSCLREQPPTVSRNWSSFNMLWFYFFQSLLLSRGFHERQVSLKTTLYQMNFPFDELPSINKMAPSRRTTLLLSTWAFVQEENLTHRCAISNHFKWGKDVHLLALPPLGGTPGEDKCKRVVQPTEWTHNVIIYMPLTDNKIERWLRMNYTFIPHC